MPVIRHPPRVPEECTLARAGARGPAGRVPGDRQGP